MNQEQLLQLNNLEERLTSLLAYKEKVTQQRISYPLDTNSKRTISNIENGIFLFIKQIDLDLSLIGSDFLQLARGIEVNKQKRALFTSTPLHSFNVSDSTDIFTADGGGHNLKNGDVLHFATDGTLAEPLSTLDTYYVINASSPTFQVSLTLGGSALDITVAPVGTQYYGVNLFN